jgi:hypothetical protein
MNTATNNNDLSKKENTSSAAAAANDGAIPSFIDNCRAAYDASDHEGLRNRYFTIASSGQGARSTRSGLTGTPAVNNNPEYKRRFAIFQVVQELDNQGRHRESYELLRQLADFDIDPEGSPFPKVPSLFGGDGDDDDGDKAELVAGPAAKPAPTIIDLAGEDDGDDDNATPTSGAAARKPHKRSARIQAQKNVGPKQVPADSDANSKPSDPASAAKRLASSARTVARKRKAARSNCDTASVSSSTFHYDLTGHGARKVSARNAEGARMVSFFRNNASKSQGGPNDDRQGCVGKSVAG